MTANRQKRERKGPVGKGSLPRPAAAFSRARIALLFRICFGLLYAVVFLSLLPQVRTLIGSNGLLPIADLVQANPGVSYLRLPTLHLFFHSDVAILLLLWLGVIASLALTIGIFPRASLVLCILLYLSVVVSGRDFFSFQWDSLLIEASFLALFLPLGGRLGRPREIEEPSPFAVFLFWWLLLRVYVESGIAKLLYGQGTWSNLSAMTFYYETAPLPSFGGWLVQQLPPHAFHVASALAVFALELGIPLLIFCGRRWRALAFATLASFGVIIAFTSNFGFFNTLLVVISLFLLDDGHLAEWGATCRKKSRWCARWLSRLCPNPRIAPTPKAAMVLTAGLAAIIIPLSILEFIPFAEPALAARFPPALTRAMDFYEPFRVVNRYHLFPGIVKERIAIQVEGSADAGNWTPYTLRYTPSDPRTRPPWLPLYQARFPFQYSFLTLRQSTPEYFRAFLTKLCVSPADVGGLLDGNPFPQPPRDLRLDFYRYRFSSPAELLHEGLWWHRDLVGYSHTIPCSALAPTPPLQVS